MQKQKKKVWIKDETFDLIEEKRKFKNTDSERYKEMKTEVKDCYGEISRMTLTISVQKLNLLEYRQALEIYSWRNVA